jgi:putative membrane protein insertion efficiency factor
MRRLCIALIRWYQRYVSPLKSAPTCRFYPTCSAYAVEAFEKRGFFVGMILTVTRILRCHPFTAGGYDPVPERGLSHKRGRAYSQEEDAADTDVESAQDNDDRAEEPPLICEDYLLRRERRGASEDDQNDA